MFPDVQHRDAYPNEGKLSPQPLLALRSNDASLRCK
jgi:hypothetical protein